MNYSHIYEHVLQSDDVLKQKILQFTVIMYCDCIIALELNWTNAIMCNYHLSELGAQPDTRLKIILYPKTQEI